MTGQVTENKFGPLDFEQLDKCPWCCCLDSRQWGEDAGLFNTVECTACGLIYVNRRLNSKARCKHYENYFSTEHQAVPEAKVRDKMYQLEFDFIYRYVKKGKVLDVGCSGGEFLDYFNKQNFDCYGVEIGSEAAQNAQRKFNDKIINISLLEVEIGGPFDLIVFRGTIEHIPDAKETLIKSVSLLNKKHKSYIYITSTPNANCISAKLFKTNWNQHMPEGHLFHFKKEHFDELFEKYGLHCIASHYFYEETPYANVTEDILMVAKAIKLKKQKKTVNFKSPPFYGNLMTLVYCLKK